MKTLTLALLTALVTTACITVGPDYARPDIQAPTSWRIEFPKAEKVANTKWWEQFDDPVLNTLIETALRENLDVHTAAARIDQFIGTLHTTRAQSGPQLGYNTNISSNRASRAGQPPIPAGADPNFSLYQATLGASWQLDMFGRVSRLSEAAQAQVYASEQAQRGVVLSLVAGVASSYIALRGLDRQREIATATATNFQETLKIFALRHKAGLVSEIEVSQVRSQYQQALALVPAIDQQIGILENQIAILLAREPGPIPRGKTIEALIVPLIPSDLPSALLERRPDILQAEQNLVTANANVGATRALYYPSISLTGVLGSVSTAFSKFLTEAASAWSLGGGLSGPIFTAGAIEGQVQSTEAQKRQAQIVYRQTVLNAFRDTNDALIGSQQKIEEVNAQHLRVEALATSARLSRLKFENGLNDYFEVLIADNELFAAQLALIRTRSDLYTQVVNVYQTMGGGWVDIADSFTPHPLNSRKKQTISPS